MALSEESLHKIVGKTLTITNLKFKNLVSSSGQCYEFFTIYSEGVWNLRLGESIFEHGLVRFHVQLVLMFFLAYAFHQLLKHLYMSRFTSEILAGLVLGPSVFGQHFPNASVLVFPQAAPNQVMASLSKIGLILFTFLTRMDASLMKQTGKIASILGLFMFLFPNLSMQNLVATTRDKNPDPAIAPRITFAKIYFGAITRSNFVGVSYILMHLKITNSRLGHLDLSSSLMNELAYLAWLTFIAFRHIFRSASPLITFQSVVLSTILFLFIVLGLRKMVLYFIKRTPEGEPMSELYTTMTIMMVLFLSSVGDHVGLYYLFGPLIFGLVVPARSPLAEVLIARYYSVVSGFLIPLMNVFCASKVDVWKIFHELHLTINFQITVSGFMSKLIGTFAVVLCCKIPLRDAAALTIILCAKGVTEVGDFLSYGNLEIGLTESTSGIFLVFLLSAFQPTLVKMLYDPAKQYIGHRKKCIEQASSDAELHILVCAQRQEDAVAAIKLLEYSNPTKQSHLSVYGLPGGTFLH